MIKTTIFKMNMCPEKLIYNPVTNKCIQDTAANRRRIAGYNLTDINSLVSGLQNLSMQRDSNTTNKNTSTSTSSKTNSSTSAKSIKVVDNNQTVFCSHKCKNNLLYLSPTLTQGDCEFDSVRQIINSENLGTQWTIEDLRELCAAEVKRIPTSEIMIMRAAYDEDRVSEKWMRRLPLNLTISEYQNILSQAMKTNDFWGDQFTLNMMSFHLNIQFIVLDLHCNIVHTTSAPFGSHIGLLYREGLHYSPLYTMTSTNERRFVFNFDDRCIKTLSDLNWS